ncbi:MAG: hypothetical protein JO011_22170, partial [Ktedonobacteraceae bacterium]|nr:hypothetical protein [Ktedonobacteraceae bacterium]
ITEGALHAGVPMQELRNIWQDNIQNIYRTQAADSETGLADRQEPVFGSELFTDRAHLQKTCLDIIGTDEINTVKGSIQGLIEREETVIPSTATPREKARLALHNASIQDQNAKVTALKEAFDVWDNYKTAENADAVKLTASDIVDFTARNDYNLKCLQKTLSKDKSNLASRRYYQSLMMKENLPFSEEDVKRKFSELEKDIPELQEIKKLIGTLGKSRNLLYDRPEDFPLFLTNTVDELAPLVIKAEIQQLINKGEHREAEILISQEFQAREAFKEKFYTSYESSLKKYHDQKRIELTHKLAMKHLIWYAFMFLGANANQVAANGGQDFQQAANNIFRLAVQGN